MQVVDPDGYSPGGPAVLEVWPPLHCSPVHNHANAYGAIKLLHGSICV